MSKMKVREIKKLKEIQTFLRREYPDNQIDLFYDEEFDYITFNLNGEITNFDCYVELKKVTKEILFNYIKTKINK